MKQKAWAVIIDQEASESISSERLSTARKSYVDVLGIYETELEADMQRDDGIEEDGYLRKDYELQSRVELSKTVPESRRVVEVTISW